MSSVVLVVLAVSLGVPLLLGGIITIIVLASRNRPQPGLGVETAPPLTPGGPPRVRGTWNALVLADGVVGALGGTLGSTPGVLHVEEGVVSFRPGDGQAGAGGWQAPGPSVTARRSRLELELWVPEGHLRLTVSRESLSRWSHSDLRSLREGRTADEVVGVLAANGARIVP